MSDDLKTLIGHQRDTLSKVESENESISHTLIDAIGSIQFQDIIRQQLEQLISMAEMVSDHMRTVRRGARRTAGRFQPDEPFAKTR